MNTRDIALTATFTALYTVLVITLAPISYGPLQLRIADVIIPLAMLFGWPLVTGVSIGCLVANLYGQLGPLDYLLGPLANLVAGTMIYLLRRRPLLASSVGSLPIGVIVGSYLWTFFPAPGILALPDWLAMVVSITLSSYIVVGIIGYILYRSMSSMMGPRDLGKIRSAR